MKKIKGLLLIACMVMMLACFTGCGAFSGVIEVAADGTASMDTMTGYQTVQFAQDWAFANENYSGNPSWVGFSWLRGHLVLDMFGEKTQVITDYNADDALGEHMISKTSTSSVYEMGFLVGNYDLTKLQDKLSDFKCNVTVTSKGNFGLSKVTFMGKDYAVGSSYVTSKGNAVWSLDVAGMVRDNWSAVVASELPTMQLHFSTSASTGSNGGYRAFTDVKNGQWYERAVNTMYWNGLINGVGNGQFSPNSQLTVAQICKLLTNIIVPDLQPTNNPYWAYDSIYYAVTHGWVEDRGEITPENYNVPIRRAEAFHAAAVAFRIHSENNRLVPGLNEYSQLAQVGIHTYRNNLGSYNFTSANRSTDSLNKENWSLPTDDPENRKNNFSFKFKPATFSMYQYGFINGDQNGKVNPLNYLTRAEFCQIIYNIMYYDYIETSTPTHCSMANFGGSVPNLAIWYRAFGIGGTGSLPGSQFNG